MVMKIPNDDFEAARLIWWISIALLPLYLLGCHVLGIQIELSENAPVSVMEIRTGCFVIIIWLYASANIFRSNRLKMDALPDSGENTASKPDHGAFLGLQRYSITILVCMGLSGGIALLGFILCLLGDDKQIVYLFVVISGVAVMILRPKPEEYEHYQKLEMSN